MQARLGPGPVFVYEWLTATRRWQLYALRAGFVCAILAGMACILEIDRPLTVASRTTSLQALANYGRTLYLTIVSIELSLVLLVAPAATAGAVCLDKARGTLDHMLATDLSNAEIVLGKLGVRLLPVLGLIGCLVPIMALAGLLGGIDPNALFGSFLTAVGCAVLGCSLALTLSVWGRKTQDVLMLTYLLIVLWLFSRYLLETMWSNTRLSSLAFFVPRLWDWLEFLNPYYLVWAPYSKPGTVGPAQYLEFLGICLGVSGILAGLATYRIRTVARAHLGRRPKSLRRGLLTLNLPTMPTWTSFLGPSLDGNPVFWREWCRAKPSRLMRLVWALYCVMGMAFVGLTLSNLATGGTSRDVIASGNVFQVAVGLLLLSVNASTSLAEERVRGSLDILLSTPLSTRSILAGKWVGAFRSVPALLFAPALTALLLTWNGGRWNAYLFFLGILLAYCAVIVSLGLALATWQSRLGRAVALCVAAYVVFLFGWPALIMAMAGGHASDNHVIVPLIMGTPLGGTLVGTLLVAEGPNVLPSPNGEVDVWIGFCLWIATHGGVAAALYAATLHTFDRCLGRMPEWDPPFYPRYSEDPAAPRTRGLARSWETFMLVTLVCLVSLGADGPHGPVNLNLEDGKLGEVPSGWFLPGPSHAAGYRASLTEDQPKQGRRCAVLKRDGDGGPAGFGNLMQEFDAADYRGRRIRMRAAVRTDGRGTRAQLWLRVDRKGGNPGFFDNMGDRPVVESKWREYEIAGPVAEDAESIALGLLIVGNGKAWLDAVSVESIGEIGEGNEPPRPLAKEGLENLVAFGRLLGYVRYFHPSDEAAATNWDKFAIEGVRAVERANDPTELKDILERLFLPIAPSLKIYPTGKPAPLTDANSNKPHAKVLAWRHIGVGLAQSPIYSSKRIDVREPQAPGEARAIGGVIPDPGRPLVVDLGGGCSCEMPLAVYADENATQPAGGVRVKSQKSDAALPAARPPGFLPSGNDRATRLAGVILTWNVFQHFYPYFDVAKADWPGELRRALTRAAADVDAAAFLRTLRQLVAAVQDGHGGVYGPGMRDSTFPPFAWDWVEGQLVITGVVAEGKDDLKPGDCVDEIDGRPTRAALAEVESMISSATPQWRRERALAELASGAGGSEIVLKVQAPPGKDGDNPQDRPHQRTVRVQRSVERVVFQELREPRPAKVATLKPGVIYADLSRITQPEFDKIVPQLAEARGIVFDLRGYPSGISVQTIGHLTDKAVTCAQWHVPVTYFPDRREVTFRFSNWTVSPAAPRFKAKVAFLTDGRAISYAETYLGIIEHYKLAEIVGGATAGTNGNVNPLTLPGDYRVMWTGMKVLKHDGSRHHGVGIQPTVPVERTIRGVAQGRDEVLDRAVAVVSP